LTGLVTAACFAETGNDVCCVDINPEDINALLAFAIEKKIDMINSRLEELEKNLT